MSIDAWMREHYGSPETYLRELLPVLEAKGVQLLAADYSGGNDEGGVQQITLYTTIVRDDDGFAKVESRDVDTWTEIPYDGDWNDPLHLGCDQILGTKYGSWAGDYSAWGVLYIDVAKRRCWMDGSETVEQAVDLDDAIDVTV